MEQFKGDVPVNLQSLTGPLDILQFDYLGLISQFESKFGKGEYHAGALFRALYREGISDPHLLPEFDANPSLAEEVKKTFGLYLPNLAGRSEENKTDTTYKFLLQLKDGFETESVVIPMRHYKSLCVSSQVGCKMGCTFCETAQMGLLRSLTASEIVSQVMIAKLVLREPIENLVFMGMGEPMDNLEEILKAISLISDQRGLNIPESSITISTVGHVDGIRKISMMVSKKNSLGEQKLKPLRIRLAVSLNAPNDEIRSRIMPINKKWPLAELKKALIEFPLYKKSDFIFMEYVLIPGVNDLKIHALEVADYLQGLKACVNLIPYNPRLESPFEKPARSSVVDFYKWLMEAGQYCRVRGTKGQDEMAACGQLGNRSVRRGGAKKLSSFL